MPLSSGMRLGPYEILAPLGAGGMGEVYRARDIKLGREVAVKVLPEALANDAQYMARFEREAQILAALNHPNIATVYGIEQGALIMELVEGQTLAECIAAGALAPDAALPIARQIADGLEAAHERGIVHRDLKPANVKITPAGVVKLLDFGLAKTVEAVGPASSRSISPTLSMAMTQAGMILGTAGYMAPEQAAGKPVDKRADIWAFGVVLYELLTGKRLFEGETVAHTLAHVLTRELDLTTIDPVYRPLLRRCLERDPRRRLRDIGEARIAIDEYLAGKGGPEPTGATSVVVQRRSRWPWVAAVALGVGLAALAAVHFSEKIPERAAVRFDIPPPEKASYGNGMALSPDGKRLAIVASAEGRSSIWVRSLDSLTAQVLAGTEGANFPFWSPDSRFLGFFVQGKLKKIDGSGGPAQTLCDVPNWGVGGSWNRDGVILFGTNGSGLFRVPQAGGAATPVTTRDESPHALFHARPWFLPDGRHFLFYSQTNELPDHGIYLATLEGKERKLLVNTSQGGAYVPPATRADKGYLLFLREATLMAQALDPASFEKAGDAFPVAEQVGSTISNPFFSVSANGVLVYRAGASGSNTQLAWFDREGKPAGVVGPPGLYNELALSPDGKQVAVSKRDAQTGNRDIWLMDVARGVPTRFTFDPALEQTPVWSPDGRRLVFSSARDGVTNLYLKGSGGAGNEESLLKSAATKFAYDWSDDGRYLLYIAIDDRNRSHLWVLPDPAGASGERKPRAVLAGPFSETQGQFCPGPAGTARWIAYASNESGRYEVYVQPLPETSSAPAGKFQISSAGGVEPRWRRDGKELYYIAPDGRVMAAEVKTSPQFEQGIPKALFQTRIAFTSTYFHYAPAADGKRFLIVSQMEESTSSPVTVVLNWLAGLKQ